MGVNIRNIIRKTVKKLQDDTLSSIVENVTYYSISGRVYDPSILGDTTPPPVITEIKGWVLKLSDDRRDFTQIDKDSVRLIFIGEHNIQPKTNDEFEVHFGHSGVTRRYSVFKVKPTTAELATVILGVEIKKV